MARRLTVTHPPDQPAARPAEPPSLEQLLAAAPRPGEAAGWPRRNDLATEHGKPGSNGTHLERDRRDPGAAKGTTRRGLASPGETLRAARLRRRLSLADAERDTHIRQQYLQALEDDDYAAVPSGVYQRGFLRNYAIYLGVPPVEVLGSTRERREDRQALPNGGIRSFARPARRPIPRLVWLAMVAAVLAVLAIVALVWLGLTSPEPGGDRDRADRAAATTIPHPAASATALIALPPLVPTPAPTSVPTRSAPTTVPPAASAPRTVDVELRTVDRSWVRATVDGRIVLEETLNPGQTIRWSGQQSVALRVGNAGGVEVTLNGQRLGTLGPADQAVDREFTK